MRRFVATLLLGACGTLPLTGPDGGNAAAPDATSDVVADALFEDATTDAIAFDATADGLPESSSKDATFDTSAEASCAFDAGERGDAFVDLDAATAAWGRAFGIGEFWSAAVDSKKNILLGGSFGTISDMSFFLQELDSAGNLLWSKTANSSGSYVNHRAWSVTFDAAGNMYAAGETGDAIDLGGGALGPGAFVVKYDAAGNFVWEYGPFAYSSFHGVRVKSDGNVVITGNLHGTADFGGGSLSSVSGSYDALLVEVTSCKTFVRALTWGDVGSQEIDALAVDSNDDIIVGGRFESAIDFGGGTMTGPTASGGVFNLFVAKLDPNANYIKQMNTGSASNNDYLQSVDTDSNDNVFVGGIVAVPDSVDLGGGKLTAIGQFDFFAGELDPSLGYKWGKHVGGTGNGDVVEANAVAADPTGAVGVAGFYRGSDIDFGQGALPSGQGVYLVRFDSSGNLVASWGAVAATNNQGLWGNGAAFVTWPDFVVVGGGGGFNAPSGTVGPGAFAVRLTP